jgi:hypothetical protein
MPEISTHRRALPHHGRAEAYISRVLNGGANFTLASMTKLGAALGMELRMHLASRESFTVWRDVFVGQSAVREVRSRMFTAAFDPTRAGPADCGAAGLYGAPVTPAAAAEVAPAEEGGQGAAASAA